MNPVFPKPSPGDVRLPLKPGPEQAREASRYRGSLLGGAVGDALGAPVEFMRRDEIARRFGPEGIRDYVPCYGRAGAITDDTQMTLFTAEGLLRAWVRLRFRGIGPVFEGVTANAYLRWLRTQGARTRREGVELEPSKGRGNGWLLGHRELFSRRAPGNTCLAALRAMTTLDSAPSNDSKGCGGVMRVAPVGLFLASAQPGGETDPDEYALDLGSNIAGITHGHPTGRLAAGAFALIVKELVEDAPLADAIATTKRVLRTREDFEETLNAIERAERLAASGVPAGRAIAEIGEGWTAEEALAIALYCSLVSADLESGVVMAVNHDGDSDSTGSIAGNLLGAIHGKEAIPSRWLRDLELRDVIADIADDLVMFPDWVIGEYEDGPESRFYWERYPGF